MADLIDRDAAYDAIGFERCDRSCADCPTKCTWFYTVKNIPAVNRWISCSERLPENEGIVLVYYRELDMVYTGSMFCDKSGWNIDCGSEADSYCDFDKITHWMPLPETPESSEKE